MWFSGAGNPYVPLNQTGGVPGRPGPPGIQGPPGQQGLQGNVINYTKHFRS